MRTGAPSSAQPLQQKHQLVERGGTEEKDRKRINRNKAQEEVTAEIERA